MRTKVVELMARKQAETRQIIDVATIMQGTGLSRPTVSTWIKGSVSRFDENTIVKLCEYFNCDVGDLLTVVKDEES